MSNYCEICDDYGVMDGLEPCPEECPRSIEVMASLDQSFAVKLARRSLEQMDARQAIGDAKGGEG